MDCAPPEPWVFDPHIRDKEVWSGAADEHQWWPRTLWIDPGGTSGTCVLWFDAKRFLDPQVPLIRCILAWQASFLYGPENDQATAVCNMVRELGGPTGLSVGVESFTVRKLDMSNDFLSPVRIKSIIDHRLWNGLREYDGVIRRRPIFSQSPADAKTTVTDDRLRLWHLYTAGADHARDATRHAVLHLRKMRAMNGDNFRRLWGWEKGW